MPLFRRPGFPRRSPDPPERSTASDEDVPVSDNQLEERAEELLLPGFRTMQETVDALREEFELDDDDPRPSRTVASVRRARLAEQESWAGASDHDRLVEAFRTLGEMGIVGRMAFACCQTCGTAEIDDERTADPDAWPEAYPWREWGYTFFHEQDADRLATEPADLYLTFSTWRPAPGLAPELLTRARNGDDDARREVFRESDARVGQQVADAVRRVGLEVDWSGDPAQRIAVRVDRWRRRLPD
ncbi:DUF6891 domain-containing protein [Luteimicrobium sp. DT211]|uniref:DUF6891 domain-containing protein n=1 Tax=Luteimicrobium sp. DT211 TaxID=3393412 RepID=UPI003CF3569F